MPRTPLCLALSSQFSLPLIEQVRLFQDIGFHGFFTSWDSKNSMAPLRKAANETGMLFQSVHAPFDTVASLWFPSEATQSTLQNLLQCIRDSADCSVPLVVMHAYIGFEKDTCPTAAGLDHFGMLFREAEKLGVQIALENTEGARFLSALMQHFTTSTVGFCWDTGHQMCYNPDQDMMALYADRLLGTHLNDNLGVKDLNGEITWLDDLHLLPFDGIGDWHAIARKIAQSPFQGPLTFELNTHSKPGRHENDPYARMDIQDYLVQAYMRACRVAALTEACSRETH